MPIDRLRYPHHWKRISWLIRYRRAQGRCEWCQAQAGKAHPVTGSLVVLTVAHLGEPYAAGTDKDDKFDIRAENIAELCCYCHLRLDRADHIRAARINRERRKRFREPLLPYFCAPPLIFVPCTEAP
jgi:hypothetical protein